MSLYDWHAFCNNPIFYILVMFGGFIALSDICIYLKSIKKHIEPNLNEIFFLTFSFNTRKIIYTVSSLLICLITLFLSNEFVIKLGCEDIRVMPEGTYCYFVEATNEKDKTYTLPAKIRKANTEEYYIENVFFKNGGFLYFEWGDYVEYNEIFYCNDQNQKEWEIKLTNKKTYHPKVKTEMNLNVDFLIYIFALFHFFSAIVHFLHFVKYHKKHKEKSNRSH